MKNLLKESFPCRKAKIKKLFLTMKLTIALFFVAVIQVNAVIYSQDAGFTISESGISIKEVLKELETNSSYRFFYSENWLFLDKKIDIKMKDEKIENVLENLFENSTLTYKVFDNDLVVIIPKSDGNQQDVIIKGKVVDSNGDVLPGVNVLVKGTNTGAVTNIDGEYTISIPSSDATLVFSFIGYLTEEVEVNGKTVVDMQLVEDIKSLEEVVVIGYGTQKKSDLTGAVSSVKAEDFQKMSVRRIEEAIQGRAAGVMISKGKGSPGSSASIHVRGAGSIGETEPLWIVDGVRMDPGNHLNMNDVASVEILKDAAAAAIYGTGAAHGVILVTTKRGTSSKPQVNFRSSVGKHTPTNLPEMCNTEQFLELNIETRKNAGEDYSAYELDPSTLPDTDWIGEVWSGSGIEQNYNLSVSGGSENASYFLSTAYDKEVGTMVDNWFDKFSIRANSDFKIGKRIKIGESLAISRTRENPTMAIGSDFETIIKPIPTMPLYDEDNIYGGWGRGPSYWNGKNPVAAEYQHHKMNTYNRVVGNIYASIDIFEGLTAKATFGGEISDGRRRTYIEAYDYGTFSNTTNSLTYIGDFDDNFLGNIVLNYEKTFGSHYLQAMAGYEAQKTNGWIFGSQVQDFPVTYSDSQSLSTGTTSAIERENIEYSTLLSQFGRLTYNYAGKYLFQANVRRDGSSNFGSGFRWGIFPSASVGWRVSDEDFMSTIDAVSNLKIRASWGKNGSDKIDQYLYSATYSSDKSMYLFSDLGEAARERGFYLSKLANENAHWEEIVQTDFGFDLGLFDNKVSITTDYYIKKTDDMLYDVELPLSFGVSANRTNSPEAVPSNIGTMENRGLEIAANYQDRIGDFGFSFGANAAFNKNEITMLSREDDIITAGYDGIAFKHYLTRTEVGEPMGYFYGYIVDGIFQNEDEVNAANAGAPSGTYWQSGTAPGDFKYKDIASLDDEGNVVMIPDGEITEADKTNLGNPWPKMIYGFNVNLDYKGFDFSMFFQGVYGVEIFNTHKSYLRNVFQDYNTSVLAYERWTGEGSINENPRLNHSDPSANFGTPSSYFVEDGSYLKLRNIQLGYSLPSSLLSKMNIASLRIFVSGQNLFTITKYEGMDPELAGVVDVDDPESAGNNTQRGIDGYSSYPHNRMISGGIEVTF